MGMLMAMSLQKLREAQKKQNEEVKKEEIPFAEPPVEEPAEEEPKGKPVRKTAATTPRRRKTAAK